MDFCLLFQQLSRDALGCVFLFSGSFKIFGIKDFRENLLYIPYIRPLWTYLIALLLPPLEIVTAIGLFANTLWSKFSALGLLCGFLGVTFVVLWKKVQVSCHCFGPWGKRSFSWETVVENLSLLVLTLACLSLPNNPTGLTGASAAALLLVLYGILGQLLHNAQLVAEL